MTSSSPSTSMRGSHRFLLNQTRLSYSTPLSIPAWCIFIPLLCIRLTSSIYSIISDCDETYNYWEALHLLLQKSSSHIDTISFKTWEYDPRFAIRSWFYLSLHFLPAWIGNAASSKVTAFYLLRISLAVVAAFVEFRFIKTVSQVVNPRCGWFMFLIMLCSAGLWSSSVALLPSTFTLYTTTLAMSFAFQPAQSDRAASPHNLALPRTVSSFRVFKATAAFALGAIVGWPFALVLAVPFVLEEVLLPSGNLIRGDRYIKHATGRLTSFMKACLVAGSIAIPTVIVDSLFYGKFALVPFNIVAYNILSAKRGAGPELYGVEPAWYYLANLALNVGPIVLFLALGALPALLFVWIVDRSRLASLAADSSANNKEGKSLISSSKLTLLVMRILPFYLWLGLLSTQAHKEERFMFPAYTSLCFNAALTLELGVGVVEKVVLSILRYTSSDKGQPNSLAGPLTSLPNLVALSLLIPSAIFSLLRVMGVVDAYSAPVSTLYYLNNEADTIRSLFTKSNQPIYLEDLFNSNPIPEKAPEKLNVCYGKEWYRFPTSFLIPNGYQGQFIQSEFTGILPKHFPLSTSDNLLEVTRRSESSFNDLNQQEISGRFIDVDTECHLLIDSDQKVESELEPNYLRRSKEWQPLFCAGMMDGEASKSVQTGKLATIARILWIPERKQLTVWKRFCLLSNKSLMKGQAEDEDEEDESLL